MENGKQNQKARELFFKYGCSHFFMEREGEYELYKKYEVSKELEVDWSKEYLMILEKKIKKEEIFLEYFSEYGRIVSQYLLKNSFENLLKIVEEKKETNDSFIKIRLAEVILNTVQDIQNETKNYDSSIQKAISVSCEILRDVIKKPIEISKYYMEKEYLKDVLLEDNLIDRAKKNLEQWRV